MQQLTYGYIRALVGFPTPETSLIRFPRLLYESAPRRRLILPEKRSAQGEAGGIPWGRNWGCSCSKRGEAGSMSRFSLFFVLRNIQLLFSSRVSFLFRHSNANESTQDYPWSRPSHIARTYARRRSAIFPSQTYSTLPLTMIRTYDRAKCPRPPQRLYCSDC